MTRLLFCQNDSPLWGSFWKKDSLITHILFPYNFKRGEKLEESTKKMLKRNCNMVTLTANQMVLAQTQEDCCFTKEIFTRKVPLKFSFSEKATKFAQSSLWFWRLLSKCQNHKDDCTNFCGLLRKAELYLARSFLAFLYQNIITGFSRCTSAFPDICVLHTTSWLGIWCLRLGTKGKKWPCLNPLINLQ